MSWSTTGWNSMAAKARSRRVRKVDCGPDVSGPCDCRTAVLRAFESMLVSGATTPTALDVAARVYTAITIPRRRPSTPSGPSKLG